VDLPGRSAIRGTGAVRKANYRLIENHPSAANSTTPAAGEPGAGWARLSKAPVRFAEKVLFVADNTGLLGIEGDRLTDKIEE